jgi:hypothetical protein
MVPRAKQKCNIDTDKVEHSSPHSCTTNRENGSKISCESLYKSDEVQESIKLDQTLRTSNRQNKAILRNDNFYGKYRNK